MLGTTGENANTIEENTHIAYLCDLLERIWGHGLKKREVCVHVAEPKYDCWSVMEIEEWLFWMYYVLFSAWPQVVRKVGKGVGFCPHKVFESTH